MRQSFLRRYLGLGLAALPLAFALAALRAPQPVPTPTAAVPSALPTAAVLATLLPTATLPPQALRVADTPTTSVLVARTAPIPTIVSTAQHPYRFGHAGARLCLPQPDPLEIRWVARSDTEHEATLAGSAGETQSRRTRTREGF